MEAEVRGAEIAQKNIYSLVINSPLYAYSPIVGLEGLVSSPDPCYAAAGGLHHRYASGDVIHPLLRVMGLGTRLWKASC